MTDFDTLAALLTEWDVGFYVGPNPMVNVKGTNSLDGMDERTITCEARGKNIEGYFGFVTIFRFSASGKFLKMGAWE